MKILLRMQTLILKFVVKESGKKNDRLHFKPSRRSPAPQAPDAKTAAIKINSFDLTPFLE